MAVFEIGKLGDLKLRFLSSIVLGVFAVIVTLTGGGIFAVFVVLVATALFREWTRIRQQVMDWWIVLIGFGVLSLLGLLAFAGINWFIIGAILILLVTLLPIVRFNFFYFTWISGGLAYCAGVVIPLILISNMENGPGWVLLLLSIIWATDTGAYFFGRFIGGPKVWPRVSPKKTWAGAVGGLFCAIVCGLLVFNLYFGGSTGVPISAIALVAACVSCVGQIGDFFESGLKRAYNMKDSGTLIPGHGGMMDRLDSLVFAAPLYLGFVYYIFV